MGYYINPPDMSKEEFLAKHGKDISTSQVLGSMTEPELPVCLVDNRAFTAAGIAYDANEAKAFLHPDGRTKRWYAVPREALKPYYK